MFTLPGCITASCIEDLNKLFIKNNINMVNVKGEYIYIWFADHTAKRLEYTHKEVDKSKLLQLLGGGSPHQYKLILNYLVPLAVKFGLSEKTY